MKRVDDHRQDQAKGVGGRSATNPLANHRASKTMPQRRGRRYWRCRRPIKVVKIFARRAHRRAGMWEKNDAFKKVNSARRTSSSLAKQALGFHLRPTPSMVPKKPPERHHMPHERCPTLIGAAHQPNPYHREGEYIYTFRPRPSDRTRPPAISRP
jgi:hypothetical protein